LRVFLGRHTNRIDKKGRVSVPKPFRDALASQGSDSVFVYPSFKYPALEAASQTFIQRIVDSLDDLALYSDDQDDIAAAVLANTAQLPYDPEGRIILPKALIDHAGIGEDAVFVGRGSRFQIWSPAAFEANNEQSLARARARGATLSLRTKPGDGV
jgi:MraZ protein